MRYKLGLDMGATSIGWSVFDIDNNKLIDIGVRIFDDGREDKSKASLCVKRREARSARRLTNRKHIKTDTLLKTLTDLGLFPEDKDQKEALKGLNPYELRTKALDEQLELYHLGRAILHLAKRKGFRSNRKDNKEEGGKLLKGYQELKDALAESGARTYGEFLYKKHINNPDEAIRLKNRFDEKGNFRGGLFPFREIYQKELRAIFAKQKEYYPNILTPENQEILENIIFFQRPLKEQEEGYCIFEPNEKRIPKAHPLFQEFRIWQNILNLKFAEEISPKYDTLGKDKIIKLVDLLKNPGEIAPTEKGVLAYSKIKKALGLDKNGLFNFEMKNSIKTELEKGLLVDKTQFAISKSKHFLHFWNNFSEEQKMDIINVISRPRNYIDFPKGAISIDKEDRIIIDYLCKTFAISEDAAKELIWEINLEDDYSSLSEKAIRKILPKMKEKAIREISPKMKDQYPDACKEAGYHHSVKEYKHLSKLPYYGEILSQSCLGKKANYTSPEEQYGKINNATVHVALNQLRYLVNELIDLHGQPSDIAIEYARDLKASQKERKKMMDTRDKNERENQQILKELNSKIGQHNYTKRDILKYKIWKNMGIPKGGEKDWVRECPYSGDIISVEDLMNGVNFQIEHIIPFSRSFDDSINNKIISSVASNRYKKERTPFEAFGESKDGYDWNAIQRRAKKLNEEQQWRFSPDAMKQFTENAGPIARSINDTRYMTRLLQSYLLPIVKEDEYQTIQSVVGTLTAMIRRAWGLNRYKNKEDEENYRSLHYHHAIDAFVLSAINRGQIAATVNPIKNIYNEISNEFKDKLSKLKDQILQKKRRKISKKQ